jgi:adenylate cyclase
MPHFPNLPWARWLAAAMALAGLAVAGYVGGALLGWWPWYEVTFQAGRPRLQPSSIEAGSREVPRLSVVVLPLVNEGERDGDFFADSLSTDLTTELGRLPGTLVISRDTAFTYQGQAAASRSIARDLGVRYVVRGSVRRDGGRVRLTLAMVDGRADAQLWTRQFEMDRASLRPALAEVTQSVARSLDLQGDRVEQGAAAALTPPEVQADDLAMMGWAIFNQGLTRENLLAAGPLFDAAVARDPNSVRGWSGVAAASHGGAATGWLPDREAATERFRLALRRLQGLDETDPSTFLGRVGAAAMGGDYEGQLVAATAMIERFPNNPHGHFYRGQALLNLGRFEACVDPAQQAIRLGPRDPGVGTWNLHIATCHFMRGEYRQAAVHARSAVQSNPNPPVRTLVLAASLARDGSTDEARRIVTAFRKQYPAYRAQDIASAMASKAPPFVEGRNRMVATLRELGLP